MIAYKVENKIRPAAPEEAHFLGKVEEKFQKVIFQRVTSDHARNVVFKEAEDAFLHCVDDKNPPVGMWQGEFWGKLMLSACGCYRYTRDESIRKFIRGSVERVLAFQHEDGYLGTYKNEKHVFPADRRKGAEILGSPLNWTWNIWSRKYSIWGLVEAYQVLEDPRVLRCAAASAEQLIDMLHGMGARITETGTFFGMPSGSILKPMLVLYRLTENRKFLDFALEIAGQWEDSETCCLKLITKSLAGIPIHHWSDDVREIPVQSKGNPFYPGEAAVKWECFDIPEKSLKVYEMQSCFEGLLELYRVTGTEKYLEATRCFFDLMIRDEYNSLFSVGYNDLFINAGKYPNAITELCDVIHFMRLGTDLFELTGEARYMDYVELAFYNPFLAGVTRDGSWAARGVRIAEGHMYASQQAGFIYNHCCTNNMPRGFVRAAETLVTSSENEVYVNLYGEADVTVHPTAGESVRVQIGSGYFTGCRAELRVESELRGEKVLKLRIPAWSKNTVVSVNGREFRPEAGGFFETKLTSGAMTVAVQFDREPRLLQDALLTDFYPLSKYMRGRYTQKGDRVHMELLPEDNMARVCIGPLLMAGSVDLGSTKEELFDHRAVFGGSCSCTAAERTDSDHMALYDVTFTWPDGQTLCLPMGDFASVSDERTWEDYRYTVFV